MMVRCIAMLLTGGCRPARAQTMELVDWVNPLVGTDSKPSLSNGNTYPDISRPWGMNLWTPQNGTMGDGWQYSYGADKIRGFKQTHQPSPWMNDYGQFVLTPLTGKLRFEEDDRASWFSHKAETATPYYYHVYLADHDVTTELAPTERAARFRFTCPRTDSAYVVLGLVRVFGPGFILRVPGYRPIHAGRAALSEGDLAPARW